MSGLYGRVALGIAICAWSTSCGSAPQFPVRAQTEWDLRDLHRSILVFRTTSGKWPPRLAEACHPGDSRCGPQGPYSWGRDGWGQEIRYALSDSGFEIRSPGPDAESGTADDMVVREPDDRIRAKQLAGCYRPLNGWFRGAPGYVALDTTPGTIGPFGAGYRLVLSGIGYRGEAEWYPVGQDSVVLQWIAGFSIPYLRLRALANDTLRGRVDLFQGEWRSDVVLVRGACDRKG